MSNQETVRKGLSVKDLVTTGIFTALLFVFTMVGGVFFATNPVLTFYMPAGSALLCGPIYLLMVAKVQKRWSLTIMGVLIGIVWFVTGMHWAFALGYMLMGIIADFVAGAGQYKSKKIQYHFLHPVLPRWNRLVSRVLCRPGWMGANNVRKRDGTGLH